MISRLGMETCRADPIVGRGGRAEELLSAIEIERVDTNLILLPQCKFYYYDETCVPTVADVRV